MDKGDQAIAAARGWAEERSLDDAEFLVGSVYVLMTLPRRIIRCRKSMLTRGVRSMHKTRLNDTPICSLTPPSPVTRKVHCSKVLWYLRAQNGGAVWAMKEMRRVCKDGGTKPS